MTRPMRFYSEPTLESDPDVLPDCEVFWVTRRAALDDDWHFRQEGWYWWTYFGDSRCESYPHGPFPDQQAAIDDARGRARRRCNAA